MKKHQETKIRFGLEMLEEYIEQNMNDKYVKSESTDPHQKIGWYIGTLDTILKRIKNIKENV
ncbi:MAG: hypothetical protein CMP57_03865 [Flavobacteriales bacterium]|nr:hypothetical protein [Flavobacteriales bacterium]|tara:strand:- start:3160 stop:3345 length:186 start_codon:yes stop_codon:yes gene_type:complete